MLKGRNRQTLMKGTGTKYAGESMGISVSARLHLLKNMETENSIFGECSLRIRRVKFFVSIWWPSYVDESHWDFRQEEIKGRVMRIKNSDVTEVSGLSGRFLCQERVCWNFGDLIN